MNGTIKFHKATGPAFNSGEIWHGSGSNCVTIVSVRKYPGATTDHTSDYGVTYQWTESTGTICQHEKDAWNFQIRYTHFADLNLRKKK